MKGAFPFVTLLWPTRRRQASFTYCKTAIVENQVWTHVGNGARRLVSSMGLLQMLYQLPYRRI